MNTRLARIAFLLSGSGSTLENLLLEIEKGAVPARVVVAIADREGATGLDHARERGIPVAVVNRRTVARARYSHDLEEALRPYAPDLVVLGGFLTIFDVPTDLADRTINVHPSLLPEFGGKGFYGNRVHKAVLEAGRTETGCTVHFVTDDVDGGPIIAQATVPVKPDDTVAALAARVQAAERALYPDVIRDLAEGRVRLVHGKIERDA